MADAERPSGDAPEPDAVPTPEQPATPEAPASPEAAAPEPAEPAAAVPAGEGPSGETGADAAPEPPVAAADEPPAPEPPSPAESEQPPSPEPPPDAPAPARKPGARPEPDEPPAAQLPAAAAEPPAAPAETADAPAAAADEPPAPPEAAAAELPAPPEAAAEQPAGEPDAPAAEGAPDASEAAAQERQRPARRRDRERDESAQPEVVPGAHLEPDLVLESDRPQAPATEADPYASYAGDDEDATSAETPPSAEPTERPAGPIEFAADARYRGTGKRKTSVARVILKPGTGTYTVNGRTLESFFPRPALLKRARLPLEMTGNDARMDVVARIHGGGVSSQAGALRHGVARALVEADPNLRGELKRGGLLTRDARVKERKKAGLKKARKRPQFSKR